MEPGPSTQQNAEVSLLEALGPSHDVHPGQPVDALGASRLSALAARFVAILPTTKSLLVFFQPGSWCPRTPAAGLV
jgi:hypothetical protein